MKIIFLIVIGLILQGCLVIEPIRIFKIDGSLSLTQAHVDGEIMYVLKKNSKNEAISLVGYNRFKGKEVWRYDHSNSNDLITSFLMVERTLFLGSQSLIISINLDTSKENWRVANDENSAASGQLQMFYREGVLITPFNGGNFVAFYTDTGKVKWVNQTSSEQVQYQPVYHQGTLYYSVFSAENNIIAVDFKTGKTLWSKSFPGRTARMPVIHDGDIFVATNYQFGADKPDLFRYNLKNREIVWSTHVPETQSWGKIEIVGSTLLTVSANNKTGVRFLNFIDINSGKILRSKRAENSKYQTDLTDLAVHRGTGKVFTVLDSKVKKIDIMTGKASWHSRLWGGARVLFVHGDHLYLDTLEINQDKGVEKHITEISAFKVKW
jgi:outer membrane protein assembly factor BamB